VPLRSKGRSGMATAGHFVFLLSDVADIEQVQNEKKPFTLR
jgi:hypothetical protein